MTEVATTQSRVPVNVGVPLHGLDEAYRLSQNLALASILPQALRGKPADVLAILLYGQELGLAPMQAVQGIYVVNGRPQLAAQTWLALIRRAGHRAEVLEHTVETCTVKIVRGDSGEEHTETFDMQDAKLAGLAGKETYKQHPKRMVLSRAVANACKFVCPEVALGFYGEGELDEPAPTVVASPTLAQAQQQRTAAPKAGEVTGQVIDDEVEAARRREEVTALEQQHTAPAAEVEDPPDEPLWPDVTEPGNASGGTR